MLRFLLHHETDSGKDPGFASVQLVKLITDMVNVWRILMTKKGTTRSDKHGRVVPSKKLRL